MTTANVGDKINLTGAGPRLLDASKLKTLQFSRLAFSNPPVITMDKLPLWCSGGIQAWAPYKNSAPLDAPMFNSLTGNWEIQAYPNQAMMDDLGITDLYTIDADGSFKIQPRLLKPAEQNAVNLTISRLDAGNQGSAPALRNIKWLSGSVTTEPAGIKPPFVIGARVQLPYPMKQGYWPAVWLLKANGGWPPETDILEAVARNDLGFQLTTNMHSSVTGNEGITAQVSFNANGPGYHDYWAVVYNDKTIIAYDGVVVKVFNTPPDWADQPAYLILNYALAGPNNGWPGPLDPSITSVPPMKIADVVAAQMPATYGSGSAMVYVPPSGAAPIQWGSTSGGTTTPPPPTPAPAQSIKVTSPLPVTASGNAAMSGAATGCVNVAVFTADWAIKLSGDVTPKADGTWSLTVDATKLPVGTATQCMVAGFSTPAGVSGGTGVTAPFTLTRTAPVPAPSGGVTAAQVAALVAAQTAAQSDLNKAIASANKVASMLAALKP